MSGLDAFSRASMFAGDMLWPAELMIISFLRSTMRTRPSSSIVATSPVRSQPSLVVERPPSRPGGSGSPA